MAKINAKETGNMLVRVYNNKMITEKDGEGIAVNKDGLALNALVGRVFGDGIESRDPSLLHQFNNLVVQTADTVAKDRIEDIIGLMATYDRESPENIRQYKINRKVKSKFFWSATASGVDLLNTNKGESITAVPQNFKTGFSYNPNDLMKDSVEGFNKLVNDIADAKVRFYLTKIYAMVATAAGSGKIPARNVADAANVSLAQFTGVASSVKRMGQSKPIFIADELMIDKFAGLMGASGSGYDVFLDDETKKSFFNDLYYTKLGRVCDAVNIENPYTDATATAVELDVDKGFFLSSGISEKPFVITEYGVMKQKTEDDFETDEIQLILSFSSAINLLYGEAIGYIEDDSVIL